MGANYDCILIPKMQRKSPSTIVGEALQRLNCRVIHQEAPMICKEGFKYRSNRVVFISPPSDSNWIQLSFSGEIWGEPFPTTYVCNSLALSLSVGESPVVHLWSYNSGAISGYSIYEGGRQIEAQSLRYSSGASLGEFKPALAPSGQPTRLGKLLNEPGFDYEKVVRGFPSLENATAALTARFGVGAHLLDNCDVQDGDGGIAWIDGKYAVVELPGWIAVYYDRVPS